MNKRLRLLVIEDSEIGLGQILQELRHGGYDTEYVRVDTPTTMRTALFSGTWDVVIANHSIPHFNGINALELLQKEGLSLPFIIISNVKGEDIAVEAMKAGATDYIMMDNLARLIPSIEHVLHMVNNKRTDKTHWQKDDQFRVISDSLPVSIAYVDSEQKYRFINKAYEKCFGIASSEICGKHIKDVLGEKAYQMNLERFETVLSGKKVIYEDTFPIKSGSPKYVQASYIPNINAEDKVIGFFILILDITEKNQMEKEIKAFNESLEQHVVEQRLVREDMKKYEILINNISDLVYVCDTKGRILFVNKIFKKLTGYRPEVFYGKSFAPLFDEKNLTKVMAVYTRTLKGESPQYELRFKDTGILCEYKSLPLRDEKDNIIGVIGIARNITKRKELEKELRFLNKSLEQRVKERSSELAKTNEMLKMEISERKNVEKELRKEEEKLRSIISSLHETSIVFFDREGHFVELWGTPELDKRYGLRAANVVGRTIQEILPSKQAEQKLVLLRNLFDTGEKQIVEEFVTLPNGNFWHETSYCPMRNKDGKIIVIVGLIRDITKRKFAETALQTSEERYRRLIEGLQDNFFFYSHNTEGIFTYLSPSVTNILGYSQDEFLTHYSEYMTDNPSNKEVEIHTDLSIKGIKQSPYEVEIYHKNGLIRTLKVQEVPVFNNKSEVVSVEGIAEDITEHKRMEEALVLSEKLNAMGVMTSGIAHNFNNILAIIHGFAHLIRKRYGDHKKLAQGIDAINKATDDGANIVNRMQEFTNVDKDNSQFVPVDMVDLIKQAIKFSDLTGNINNLFSSTGNT